MAGPMSADEQLYQLGQIIVVINMYRLEKMTSNFDQRCSLTD